MEKVGFFVETWCESYSESIAYLKFNAPSIELRIIGLHDKKDGVDYLFEAYANEGDISRLQILKDVKVFL